MATQDITYISINSVALLASFPGILFIIAVNILDFWKNRRLILSDQLIFGYSFFSLLYGIHESLILHKNELQFYEDKYNKIDTHIHVYLNMCTLWFCTLLTLHFCLKIVNINHRFYISLQRRFPKLFPWIIITFLLGCFFLSLYSGSDIKQQCILNTTYKVTYMKTSPTCSWPIFIFLAICGLCTLLCSVSVFTILISLCKHMKSIQENTEGSRSPNKEAHIRAVKTVTTLLVANILIFTSVLTLTLEDLLWGHIFSILISTSHIFSVYFIIKGTKKMNKILSEILNQCSFVSGENQ